MRIKNDPILHRSAVLTPETSNEQEAPWAETSKKRRRWPSGRITFTWADPGLQTQRFHSPL